MTSSGFGGLILRTTGDVVPDPLAIPAGAFNIIVTNNAAENLVFEAQFLIGV